jgi:hypothetical protein
MDCAANAGTVELARTRERNAGNRAFAFVSLPEELRDEAACVTMERMP